MAQSRRRSFKRAFTKYNAFNSSPAPIKSQNEGRSWFERTRYLLLVGGLCLLYYAVANPVPNPRAAENTNAGLENGSSSVGPNQTMEIHHATLDLAEEQDTITLSEAPVSPYNKRKNTVRRVHPFEKPCITFPEYLDEDLYYPTCPSTGTKTMQTTLVMTVSVDPGLAPRLLTLCQNVWKSDPLIVVLTSFTQHPPPELIQELEDNVLVACSHIDILHIPINPSSDTGLDGVNPSVGREKSAAFRHQQEDHHGNALHDIPINYLHNQALDMAQTSHVLILDEKAWPMPGLERSIHSAYTRVPREDALVIPHVWTERTLLTVSDMSACVKERACGVPQGPEEWDDAAQRLTCFPSDDYAPYLVMPWCSLIRRYDTNVDDDRFNLRHRHRQLTQGLPFSWHDERLSSRNWRFAQADQWRYEGGKFWWAPGFVMISNPGDERRSPRDTNGDAFHQRVLDHYEDITDPDQILSLCSWASPEGNPLIR